MNAAADVGMGTNVAPTVGSLVGSAAGLAVASKLGFNPFDPAGGSIVAAIAAIITAGFHWLGKRTGLPGLA
jgi:hypothetical protein